MKTKLPKILSLLLTVVLLASLMIGAAVPAAAAGEAWTTMSYPRAGGLGKYIMGPATGVVAGTGPMEMAVDGTLYAYMDIAETDDLYKSADGGRTWSRCSTGTDGLPSVAITAIACSPEDANILYVTDNTDVWRSSDAGATFVTLVRPAGGITALAVGYNGGNHFIYIGGVTGGNGDVLIMQDSFGQSWASTDYDALAVALGSTRAVDAVACSPNFATEGTPQVIAVSHVTAAAGVDALHECHVAYSYAGAAWGHDTEIQENAATSFAAAVTAADIAFPADYVSTFGANDFFVGIAGGAADGDVYRIVAANDIDTNIRAAGTGTNVTSVAVAGSSGSCSLLAAGTTNADVYRSSNNGTTWQASSKDVSQATGVTAKYLVMADDYLDSGKAWVATVQAALLDESSVAQTIDAGVSWNDLSMINTVITQIHNLAVSPDYANDSTYFMVTSGGGQDGVWKYDGSQWNRVFTNAAIAAATTMVQFSPDFASDSAVFLADAATPAIYRSTNGGGWFKAQLTAPGGFTGSLIVLDSSTLIVGNAAFAAISKNNGTTWSNKGLSGATGPVLSFAKSPDYASDSTLLLGDSAGGVYRSTNSGGSWSGIPAGVATAGGGALSVAFDADYANNSTVYAVDATNAVYRLVIGTDTAWKQIDAAVATTWPIAPTAVAAANASRFVSGVQAAPDGTLYVADASATVILRSINPTGSRASTRGVYFEDMSYGFAGTAANLVGVWYSAGSNTLWTLESGVAAAADRIWVYTDDLTVAPELKSPADGTNTGNTGAATLSWSAIPGCPRYYIWVSTNSGFSTSAIPAAAPVFNVTSTTTSYSATGLAAGKTYYWKVCAADNTAVAGRALGPWSATWSVTTGLAAAQWNPFADADNVAPAPGAAGVSIRPAFQWNPSGSATGYEFELSKNPGTTARGYFVEVVTSATGANALGNTVWLCDQDLEYSTTYYWHVKAVTSATKSVWGTGVFTTEAAPAAPEPPPPPPPPTPEPTTPAYIWAVIGIGAALCLAVIVLIVRTRRVV